MQRPALHQQGHRESLLVRAMNDDDSWSPSARINKVKHEN